MNQTIMEKLRCIFSNARLGKIFQAKTVTYSCHLINHLPPNALDDKTSMEVWPRKVAIDYDFLHVFGSTAYYHLMESKLDERGKKALFIGITSKLRDIASSIHNQRR